MKVIVVGAAGRMGRQTLAELERAKEQAVAAVDAREIFSSACATYKHISEVKEEADVIVDFSAPSAVDELIEFALSRKLPLVIATTGHNSQQRAEIGKAAKSIPIFYCSNLSYGVAVFTKLVGLVASAFKYADVEIVETHHRGKTDVPSGTALTLAKAVVDARGEGDIVVGRHEARRSGEIGISSLRLGGVVGKHEVCFDTGYQTFTLIHEAQGRTLYARGAVNAMRFLLSVESPGLYGMDDLLSTMQE